MHTAIEIFVIDVSKEKEAFWVKPLVSERETQLLLFIYKNVQKYKKYSESDANYKKSNTVYLIFPFSKMFYHE